MRDAFGGIVNISFIVVFMVIISGYLAFAANYNKAYNFKNKIINIIEQNEGFDGEAAQKIDSYRRSIGYSLSTQIDADNPPECQENQETCSTECPYNQGYCYTRHTKSNTGEREQEYYTIVTAVNIDIPILNKLIPNMRVFQVNGTTKTITKH